MYKFLMWTLKQTPRQEIQSSSFTLSCCVPLWEPSQGAVKLRHEGCWFLCLLQHFKFLLYVMTDCRLQVAGRPRPWSFICMNLEVSVTLPFRTCTYMKLNSRVPNRTRELSKRNVIALLYCGLAGELHFTYWCGPLLAIDNEWMNEWMREQIK
jgi:hypothetical protein